MEERDKIEKIAKDLAADVAEDLKSSLTASLSLISGVSEETSAYASGPIEAVAKKLSSTLNNVKSKADSVIPSSSRKSLDRRVEEYMSERNKWDIERVPERFRRRIYKRFLWRTFYKSPFFRRKLMYEEESQTHSIRALRLFISVYEQLSLHVTALKSKMDASSISSSPSIRDDSRTRQMGVDLERALRRDKKEDPSQMDANEYRSFIGKHNGKIDSVRGAIKGNAREIKKSLSRTSPPAFRRISSLVSAGAEAALVLETVARAAREGKNPGLYIASKSLVEAFSTLNDIVISSRTDRKSYKDKVSKELTQERRQLRDKLRER